MQFTPSGLTQTYRIHLDDGETFEIKTKPSDVAMWELANPGKVFTENVGPATMLWVAWRAGRRTGQIEEKRFEKWMDTVAEFDMGSDDATGADPTLQDQ